MTDIEIMEKAREIVSDPKRYAKSDLWGRLLDQYIEWDTCPTCPLGAIAISADCASRNTDEVYDSLKELPVVTKFAHYLVSKGATQYHTPTSTVFLWNDRPELKQDEVVAAFDGFITELRKGS